MDRTKESNGWRAGRPVEDPEKTKRWGFVTARPSEFLVHVRGGRVRAKSSGQGATCFKWPWDAVSVVPTSLQRLHFTADQVTVEKVGVAVAGLAVYRIAEPLVAYRVLNFSYPERAQEKLEETLTGMFIGATRRLVANLTVDECLRKRKEALAGELLREVAPVVGGEGSPDDSAPRGWGVVLDTVEIQEVRVLSERVFASMQAPFRVALERAVEEARLASQLVVEERRRELTAAADETRRLQAQREAQLSRESAESDLHLHATLAEAAARRGELERATMEFSVEKRRAEAELSLVEGRARAEVALAEARARREAMEGEARLELARRLPDLAAAVGQRFGEVKVTQIGGEASPFGAIAQAVAAVLDLASKG